MRRMEMTMILPITERTNPVLGTVLSTSQGLYSSQLRSLMPHFNMGKLRRGTIDK